MNNEQINKFVSDILTIRSNAFDKSAVPNIKRGLYETTEAYAYPYVLPLLPKDASEKDQKAALYVAGLITSFKDIEPASEYTPFGKWLAIADASDSDVIATRVNIIHTQDLEEAVLSISRLLTICKNKQIPLSWGDVARTIFHWGNGTTKNSQDARMSIARNYYSNL